MYQIKKEWRHKGAKVILYRKFMGKGLIELDRANELELEHLYEIQHAYVEKINKKNKEVADN